jgi:alpha-beta hydrolase superfamily lysophospholipase
MKLVNYARKTLILLFIALSGAILGITLIFINLMQNRPDLYPWHLEKLENEYTEDIATEVVSFADYLELENELFNELQQAIGQFQPEQQYYHYVRYKPGSIADPMSYDQNWNRSFELKQDHPSPAVLLLHGLSDSPYSLRHLALKLHGNGYHVLGLRMPGHGTLPSGLVHTTWQDMAAAVKLAARHLGDNTELHIIGYSMGAAQAVNYALDAMHDDQLPEPRSLVLLSPAIGVSPVAALAVWQSRLSAIPGLDKLAWSSIGPEYDPYKYISFAVNAGDQMFRLTRTIAEKINDNGRSHKLTNFPRTLAFMSVVDATVSVSSVVTHLLGRLDKADNHLVLFDINRKAGFRPFFQLDPGDAIDRFMLRDDLPFSVALLSNRSSDDFYLSEVYKNAHSDADSFNISDLPQKWPEDVFSLSHIALPFPATDSLYGVYPESNDVPHIGLLAVKGERSVLAIPGNDMLRLRYNPFYSYLERNTIKFIER